MRHQKKLDKVTAPAARFQGWKAMPLGSKIAVVVLVALALMAILAPELAPFKPGQSGLASVEEVVTLDDGTETNITSQAAPPGGEFIFGTDGSGRDVLSRIIYGARVSLVVGISATALALAAAVVLGAIAATGRKWIAEALMRTLDVVMSFPGIALAAVLVLALSATLPTLPVVVVSIAVLYVPQLTRVVRANIISQFGEDYVAASKVMGASVPWILFILRGPRGP